MDDQGHILNPSEDRGAGEIQPYQGIHWLDRAETEVALHKIDRSTDLGKRDYALLAILLQTGRRLQEVASLTWRNVHIQGAKVTLTFEHCKGDKTMMDELTSQPVRLCSPGCMHTTAHGWPASIRYAALGHTEQKHAAGRGATRHSGDTKDV